MRLGRLIKGLNVHDFRGDPELEIKGLAYDSRSVGPGYLFVALKGQTFDGRGFMKDAVQRGAVVLVADEFQGDNMLSPQYPQALKKNSQRHNGTKDNRIHKNPAFDNQIKHDPPVISSFSSLNNTSFNA